MDLNGFGALSFPRAMSVWHLCWQAAAGRSFFPDDLLYDLVQRRLLGAHRRDGCILIDYVLLPTEIHAIAMLPTGTSPSSIARSFGNVLTRWVREADPVLSPVLAGPYQAHRIETIEALLADVRMLAWRPVRKGAVKVHTHHAHGGLRVYLGLSLPDAYDPKPLLHLVGRSVNESRSALRTVIGGQPSDFEWVTWELTHGLALARGSFGTHRGMANPVRGTAAASLVAAGGDGSIDGALRVLEQWVGAKLDSSGMLDLHKGTSHSAVRGRCIVAVMAQRHKLCAAAVVARYFQRSKGTLSEQVTAFRARGTDRQITGTAVHRIVQEVAALHAQRASRSE